MRSDERYYRHRAAQELAAARFAVTEPAAQRRLQLAESYLRRLAELTGESETGSLERAAA